MVGLIPNCERIWSGNSVCCTYLGQNRGNEGNYQVTNEHNRYLMTGFIFLTIDLRLITCAVCGLVKGLGSRLGPSGICPNSGDSSILIPVILW